MLCTISQSQLISTLFSSRIMNYIDCHSIFLFRLGKWCALTLFKGKGLSWGSSAMRSEISSVKSGQMDFAKASETFNIPNSHYDDVIMSAMASQITSLTIVYSRHRSKKTSNLRVTGLCEGNSPGPVNSPHKGPVTRKMFPFDDVIMTQTRRVLELNKKISPW